MNAVAANFAATNTAPSAATAAYVHVPFCRHRCGYCNFTVVAGRDDLIANFLQAIERELQQLGEPRPVHTLFIGGGTPTHLNPTQLADFLALVREWFPLLEGAEFSVEANPEDISAEIRDVLHAAHVNRVSLGVQSFRDAKLKSLERAHHADDIDRCFELLRPTTQSLSLDLIFGTPHETLAEWHADLASAMALNPDHVSTYGLTYEQGTSFYARQLKHELAALPEDLERNMYEQGIDLLNAHGFEHYEVSNFAKLTRFSVQGSRCRHNENYWLCGEYFGIGPGAASFLGGVRRTNHRSTTGYLKRVLAGESAVMESDSLTSDDLAHERLVFGMRRLEGIALDAFEAATQRSVEELVGENLSWLCAEGLLERTQTHLRLTRKGLLVSDSIWPYLL